MKNILTIMVCLLSTMSVLAKEEATIGNILYSVDKKEAEVIGCDANLSGSVTIPETIVWDSVTYTVTRLSTMAFRNSAITHINLPNTLQQISNSCFEGCTELTSITIPGKVYFVGPGCFAYCSNLTKVTMPDSISYIADRMFYDCPKLTSVNIPEKVALLGDKCFYNCCSLQSFTIPRSVTTIMSSCFENCSNLINVACNWYSFEELEISTNNTFKGISPSAKLYVPTGTKEMYASTEPWESSFAEIIEKGDETGIAQVPAQRGIVVSKNTTGVSISGLESGETVEVFNLQGMKIGQATAIDGTANIPCNSIDKTAIIKIGKECIKVAM